MPPHEEGRESPDAPADFLFGLSVAEARRRVGRLLTILRARCGITLEEAADIVGVHHFVLRHWELGIVPATTREKLLAYIDEVAPLDDGTASTA